MAEISWTNQAVDDLESTAEFIARYSENYAKMFVYKIMNSLFHRHKLTHIAYKQSFSEAISQVAPLHSRVKNK